MQPEKYDVVVVGSGIGGLGAGALLSHWGYKTLVVERLGRVGGRYSSEEYEGFTLPTGGISVLYKGTALEEVFKEVGAEMEVVNVPRLFFRIRGTDYEMPAKGAVSTLFDMVNKLEEERAKASGGRAQIVPTEKIMTAFRQGIKDPGSIDRGLTFKEWLLQYTDNELAHAVVDSLAYFSGGHSYEFPAWFVFTWFVRTGGFREVGIAPRGNIANMEKLAKVVRVNGDVWLNCPAKRILVTGKEAKGVVVEKDGAEVKIASKVVISNVGPRATVQMAGEENFDDEEYLRMMRLSNMDLIATMVFIASDRPLWPESGEPAILQLTETRRIIAAVPLSNMSPELAPPGQHLMFVFVAPVHFDARQYVEVEHEQVLFDIKEQFPLFEKHGRILKMVVKGIEDEYPHGQAKHQWELSVETPVRNLYNVGDGTESRGLNGGVAAIESGKRVAEIVRKLYKPGQT